MKTLLEHAEILVMDGEWRTLHNATLGMEDDRIIYLGQEPPQDHYDVRKNLSNHAIIPGFYNLHSHTPMAILRGLGSNLPLDKWLFDKMMPIERRMKPGDVNLGARISMMEMIASGVVSFSDMFQLPVDYIDEVIQSGLRANIASPSMAYSRGANPVRQLAVEEAKDFFARYNGAAEGRITADFAIHAEYTSKIEDVLLFNQICSDRHAGLQLHLSETKKEHEECKLRHGKTPARFFYDLETFDNPTTAAHCVMVEPADIEILVEKNVTAVHNPTSNMKLGSGFMPIRKLLESGVNVTIGTDGDGSNNNQNLFEEMHLAAVIHCGYLNDPQAVTVDDLLTIATINGAKAQRREHCGAIAVGNKADLAVIDLDAPHLIPNHDLPSLLLYSAQASDVVMTIVDGKLLYDHGEFLTIDFERVKHDLQKTMAELF